MLFTWVKKLRHFFPNWLVNYGKHFPTAALAIIYYRYPARHLKVIGVTGTDGKTTTTNLIYHILNKAGKKVAMISTVSAKIGNEEIDTGFHVTSPEPWQLQNLIRHVADKKFEYLVIEATSNGLEQFRLLGCNFYLGVLTNISEDHLDYHGTWRNYAKAKAKLFQEAKISILNKDDQKSYNFIKKYITGQITTYGFKNADVSLENYQFKAKLFGDYNQQNCLASIATCLALDLDYKKIQDGVTSFDGKNWQKN